MEPKIQSYADALYSKERGENAKLRRDELVETKKSLVRRGLADGLPSGIELTALIHVEAHSIGRLLRARLASYRTAHNDADVSPSTGDLDEIWASVLNEYRNQLGCATRFIENYIKARNGAAPVFKSGAKTSLESATGLEHDAVLDEWKVWREQVRLKSMPARSARTIVTSSYDFHPAILEVSNDLYKDGHFKQAVLEAFIRVINELKRRSHSDKDGDALVNEVLGAEKKIPLLRFNALASDAERDEHKGILFLFKGIVGIRNFKAHTNVIFDNPERAFEYLALASLLMRLLDLSVETTPLVSHRPDIIT